MEASEGTSWSSSAANTEQMLGEHSRLGEDDLEKTSVFLSQEKRTLGTLQLSYSFFLLLLT